MGRLKKYENQAEKQKAYRNRNKLKRNAKTIKDVTKLNEVYCMDALDFLQNHPNESVKMFVTSPPYNIRNTTGGFFKMKPQQSSKQWANAALLSGYDTYNDNMPRPEYIKWQRNCISEMLRALKPDGAIFYNHKPRVQAGLMETPHDIMSGFPVRQVIIWDRGTGFNINQGYFCPHHEYIYLICKPDFRLRSGVAGYGDIWHIKPETNNNHPAPFPVQLPLTILQAVDMTNNYVVDPFAGSGTVGIAALSLGIDYKLNDVSQKYVDAMRERLSSTQLALVQSY